MQSYHQQLRQIEKRIQIWLLWWLWNLPLATASDLGLLGIYDPAAISVALNRMRQKRLVGAVKASWLRRHRLRWYLSEQGVLTASREFFNGEIDWQITEEGLKTLLLCTPMPEALYPLGLVGHNHQFEDAYIFDRDDHPEVYPSIVLSDMDLYRWHWQRSGYPHALAVYDQYARIPFVLVSKQVKHETIADMTTHRLRGLSTPLGDPAGHSLRPAYWMIACEGLVSTELARQGLYPDEPRIITQIDGNRSEVTEPIVPALPKGLLKVSSDDAVSLGKLEDVEEWVKTDPRMVVYRDPLAGKLYRVAEEFHFARHSDAQVLWGYSGKEVKEAVANLAAAELVTRDRDGFRLERPGMLLSAQRSWVHHQTVLSRYGELGNRRNRPDRNRRRHMTLVSRLAMALRSNDIHVERGDRLFFHAVHGGTVYPDGWVEVSPRQGSVVLHAMEVEGPRPRLDSAQRRVQPYMDTQRAGLPQPLLMICLTPDSEERLWRMHPQLWALTTTVSEARHGPHYGDGSIWRCRGARCSIDFLTTKDTPAGTQTGAGSWLSRLLGRNNS